MLCSDWDVSSCELSFLARSSFSARAPLTSISSFSAEPLLAAAVPAELAALSLSRSVAFFSSASFCCDAYSDSSEEASLVLSSASSLSLAASWACSCLEATGIVRLFLLFHGFIIEKKGVQVSIEARALSASFWAAASWVLSVATSDSDVARSLLNLVMSEPEADC